KANECIWQLMGAVDSYIPTPLRPVDRPFLMPIEDIFSITGRGTVVTGRVERGVVKVGGGGASVGVGEVEGEGGVGGGRVVGGVWGGGWVGGGGGGCGGGGGGGGGGGS